MRTAVHTRSPTTSRIAVLPHAFAVPGVTLSKSPAPLAVRNPQLLAARTPKPARASQLACSAVAFEDAGIAADVTHPPVADSPAGGLFLSMLPGELYYAPCLIPMLAAVASALGARYAPALLAWVSHLTIWQVVTPS